MDAEELLRKLWLNHVALAEAKGDAWDDLCDERAELMLKVAAYFANKRAADSRTGG